MITTPGSSATAAPPGQHRFRAWAHMPATGGHFLTKSRRYSVTFGQLPPSHAADPAAATRPSTPGRDAWTGPDETVVLVLGTTLDLHRIGHSTPGGSWPQHPPHAPGALRSAGTGDEFGVNRPLTANQPIEGVISR